MSQDARAAKALSKALGHKVSADDLGGIREEPGGDLIVVTAFGHKARITAADEVELLTGPGSQPEVFEPPEPPAEPSEAQEDLPPLQESVAPEAVTEAEGDPDFFELFKGTNRQWYFHRKAANGEVVSASEGYSRRKDAAQEAERQADGLEVREV
ncbi:MAG: YegP family protein [Actinomycetota bacterium]